MKPRQEERVLAALLPEDRLPAGRGRQRGRSRRMQTKRKDEVIQRGAGLRQQRHSSQPGHKVQRDAASSAAREHTPSPATGGRPAGPRRRARPQLDWRGTPERRPSIPGGPTNRPADQSLPADIRGRIAANGPRDSEIQRLRGHRPQWQDARKCWSSERTRADRARLTAMQQNRPRS